MNTTGVAALIACLGARLTSSSSVPSSMGFTNAARHPNRLIDAISPYLLQHAHNPVGWCPWDVEALERARTEDKPIFLSIGYAACHWCHVMERESFENEGIAAFLNEHFVPIKVDREERPDLDDVYMKAVQTMTGSGGWPMSVFLTPDLKPFFAGTYFPPQDSQGVPGFLTVLKAVADAWTSRRAEVVESANSIREALAGMDLSPPGAAPISTEVFGLAEERLKRAFDPVEGGFETAPKFPSSLALDFLLERYRRTHDAVLLSMATLTLDKMAQGGIRDHLGGGFHRYSTDAHWLVPHFEKMLYDNALLAQAYLDAWRITHKPLYARVARETLDYLLRDMADTGGGFHASEDADSEGEEGRFYLWTRDAIIEALGETDGTAFCEQYGVRAEGNFHSREPYHAGLNILHSDEEASPPFTELGERLRAIRAVRVRPGRDDKVLVSWNALAISALARAGRFLEEPHYTQAAQRATEFILSTMMRNDTLSRVYRQGRVGTPAFLDDYAFLLVALTDLYETTFDARWLEHADGLARTMLGRFADPDGGFYLAASRDDLIARTKPLFDGVEPSGNSMAALGLWRLGRLLDNVSYLEAANRTLSIASSVIGREPRAFLKMVAVANMVLRPPTEVSLAGSADDPMIQAFMRVINEYEGPEPLVAAFDPVSSDKAPLPFLAGKALVDGHPVAYVCGNGACLPPAATPDELRQRLAHRS